jgi:hypothetical protein
MPSVLARSTHRWPVAWYRLRDRESNWRQPSWAPYHWGGWAKRQIQALSSDTETRVLNDLDEKIHNVVELVLERPSLRKVMDNLELNASESEQYLFTYYVLSICSQAFAMRQRNVLNAYFLRNYLRNSPSACGIKNFDTKPDIICHFINL